MPGPESSPLPTPTSPSSTSSPSPTDPQADLERWNKLFYRTSLGVVIIAPMVMLLPPRRVDLGTFGLGIAWFMSAGFCVEHKTGQGLLWHIGSRIPSEGNRRRIAEEQARERGETFRWQGEKPADRGFLKRMWMGNESDEWVEERKRKEQEALDEGKGYGGLIMDQVREVMGTKEKDNDEEDGNDGDKRK